MFVIQIKAMLTPGRFQNVWAPIGPFTSREEANGWLEGKRFMWVGFHWAGVSEGIEYQAVVLELRSPLGPVEG